MEQAILLGFPAGKAKHARIFHPSRQSHLRLIWFVHLANLKTAYTVFKYAASIACAMPPFGQHVCTVHNKLRTSCTTQV